MPKASALGNVNVLEQAGEVASKAWKQTGKGAKTVVQDVTAQTSFSSWLGLESPPSKEVIKQQEQKNRMSKIEGYKQARRRLDAILGRQTNEQVLEEEVRKQVDEEEKRLGESLQRFDTTRHETAQSHGRPSSQEEAQIEQQREFAIDEEKRGEKAEEQARLENVVETPAGRETGLNLKFNRKSNIRRGTPRATAKLRSAETRAGQGVLG